MSRRGPLVTSAAKPSSSTASSPPAAPARGEIIPPSSKPPTTASDEARILRGTIASRFSQSTLFAPKPPPAPVGLPRGVVYLPAFLTKGDCDALIQAVDGVTAVAPFQLRPVNKAGGGAGPAFSGPYLTYAGSSWKGTGDKGYERVPEFPPIPPVVLQLGAAAVHAALAKDLECGFSPLPSLEDGTDPSDLMTVIMNYYCPKWGTISPHSDTTEKSLQYPVVSFSLGSAVDFELYGAGGDAVEHSVRLQHGDAILFGGPARHIRHGISKPPSHVRPSGVRMVEGRVNITLRVL